MGCQASTENSKNVQRPDIVPPHRSKSSLPAGKGIFKAFDCIWADPQANLAASDEVRSVLSDLFHHATFVDSAEEAEKTVASSTGPFVLLSCVELADQAKAVLGKFQHVVALYVLSKEPIREINVGVTKPLYSITAPDQIDPTVEMEKAASEYYRIQRFCDDSCYRSFYANDSDESLINALGAAAQRGKFSVFFPLGIRAVKLEECLSGENIDKVAEQVMGEILEEHEQGLIKGAIQTLKQDNSLEGIVKAYTMNGLHHALNVGLRKGSGFETLLNYIFCLKGAMCEKGEPLQSQGTDAVYRYLKLDSKGLAQYQERQGNMVFMAGFTSATADQGRMKKFAWNESAKDNVVLKIQMVEPSEEYNSVIEQLGFPEENGVFFPVNISKLSAHPEESEVLFPPFYPLRIIKVDTSATPCTIVAQAPYCVNVAGKDWISVVRKSYSKEDIWNKAYLDTVLRLAKDKIISKLSIGTIRFVMHPR